MNEQSREEEIILREDWISRFFGYLGSFRYLRSRRDGKVVFENELDALIRAEVSEEKHEQEMFNISSEYKKNKERIRKNARTIAEEQKAADNIVYIYGNFNDGKTTYIDLLEQEMQNYQGEYVCLRYSFADEERNVKVEEIAEEIRELFKTIDYATFPFMSIVQKEFTAENGEKVDGYELLRAAFEIIHDKNVWAMKELMRQLKLLMNSNDIEEKQFKAFSKQFDKIKEICSDKIGFKNLRAKNPYLFLIMDLWGIIDFSPDVQFVCIIDDFEKFTRRLEKSTLEEDENKKINSIMNMMKSMSDIVWVLISNEKCAENVKQNIKNNNSWHMKGLDRKRTQEYVQLRWSPHKDDSGNIHEYNKIWLDKIYDKTGGYISLLNLCMERESNETESDIYKFVHEMICREVKSGIISEEDFRNSSSRKKICNELVDEWFRQLWNGEYGDENESESIENIFLSQEFYVAPREKNEMEANLYIPALCYLVEKSKEHKGTIKQYSWDVNEPFAELKKEARECIRRITRECMFCLEYPEYPGTFFLDPVIIDIMSKHDLYNAWLELFEKQGFLEINQKEAELENKREASSNIEKQGLEELSQKHVMMMIRQVFECEKESMIKSVTEDIQNIHMGEGLSLQSVENSKDNASFREGIDTYDSVEDSLRKETQLRKDGICLEGIEIVNNKDVIEVDTIYQDSDKIPQTMNKNVGGKNDPNNN